MKRRLKKYFKVIVLAACFSFLSQSIIYADNINMEQLQRKFPDGSYWNHVVGEGHDSTSMNENKDKCNKPDSYTWHPCTQHFMFQFTQQEIGWTDCNRYGGSLQCRGFASKIAEDVYGEDFHRWKYTDMETENIKPGDIIWYYIYEDSVYGHQAMVIDVDGTSLCLGECNWFDSCMINWGRWMDTTLVYKWTIYHAPYELPLSGEENLIKDRKGDIDGNGERSLEDAVYALKVSLGINNADAVKSWSADMDGDGNVTLSDASFILKCALGIEYIVDDAVEIENSNYKLELALHEFDEIFYNGISEENREDYFNEHFEEYNIGLQEFLTKKGFFETQTID